MRRRRHVAGWPLATLALLALGSAGAQSPRVTTVGRLLGGLVDTIEVRHRMSARLGSRGASLRLIRADSAYSGTLTMHVYVPTPMIPVRPGDPQIPPRECDTAMTAAMTPSAARRLLALVQSALIEPGEAPAVPSATDIESSFRLTSGSNAVVVRSARTVEHGKSRYRAPLRRDSGARPPFDWLNLDAHSPLMKLADTLQSYLPEDRLLAFSKACAAREVPTHSLHPDSLFDRLVGQWVLRGTIARRPTTHDVTVTWMLGREYVQMHEVSRERDAKGAPAYEAVVLFGRDPKTGEYGVLWMDNTAPSAFDPAGIGRGRVAGDSIPFLFHYSATDRFHTTFVYDRATDSWQWHMDNDSAGVRKPFARVTLTRQ